MFREIVTSSVTLANSGIVVGDNGAPAVSGLTVYGDISASGRIYGIGVGGGGGGGGDLSQSYGTLSLNKLSPDGASLGDVLKFSETTPGVSAWAPGKVLIGELTAVGEIKDGSIVNYDSNLQKFVATPPEEFITYESSYIKKMAKCAQSRNTTFASGTYNPGFAAITNDDRVIAWGNLHTQIFGATQTILAAENVRVPFWTLYDGYLSGANFRPYGGDFLDQALNDGRKYVIDDLYWSRNGAMALVSAEGEVGGDVWVAGKNLAGAGVTTAVNPFSLVKTKFNNFIIANNTGAGAGATTGGLYLLNPEKDLGAIQKFTTGAQRDIIEDKSNSLVISDDSYYYISSGVLINRINHFGELVDSYPYTVAADKFVAPNGLAMAKDDGAPGRNLLYVCDVGTGQNKVKIFNVTNNAFTFLSAIGTGTAGINDGETNGIPINFSSLKRIAIDPSNQNILYVTDGNRLRRLFRKPDGHWKVNTISDVATTAGYVNGALNLTNTSPVRFNDPYGIKVSEDGKQIYIADRVNKKIRVIIINENTLTSFSASISDFVDSNVKTAATFNNAYDSARDAQGNIYIADYSNNKIRKIAYDPATQKYGDVTTFAGNGTAGATDGTRLAAKFYGPVGITYSSVDNCLYVTNYGAHCISRVSLTQDSVAVVVGTKTAGYLDGAGTNAKFYYPRSIRFGQRTVGGVLKNFLWVADYYNYRIRQIEFSGFSYGVTTIGGTGKAPTANTLQTGSTSTTKIGLPWGIFYKDDEVYFTHSNAVQKINLNTNTISTVAGTGVAGFSSGTNAGNATFKAPYNIIGRGTDLFVADYGNNAVRKITNFASSDVGIRKVSLYAGSGSGYKDGVATLSKFSYLYSIAAGNNNDFIVCDKHTVRRIYELQNTAYVETINGTTVAGKADTTTLALDWDPYGIDIDSEDNVYFSEVKKDTIGSARDGKVSIYRNMIAGVLGIGEGSANSTCGFIKVNAVDSVTGIIPKFKRIQFVGDSSTAMLFAALDTEDSLWVWGNSPDGAFGNGRINSIGPTKLYSFEKNVLDFQITCSAPNVSLISLVTKDYKLYTSGDNTYMQLGRGDITPTSPTLAYSILRQCKKGASQFVDDARKIIESRETGFKNHLYISVTGDVWACGDHATGVLGRGTVTARSPYFAKVDNLTNITYLLGVANNNYANHIIFALKDDGTLWSWGYNGAAAGQTLTNDITNTLILSPAQCFSFETRDVVRNAVYVFGNDNAATNQTAIAYLDDKSDLYLGGYSTEAEVPLFPNNIPYFRKFNMRNILPDVNLVGEAAAIHRKNGTVYSINKFGAKKLF